MDPRQTGVGVTRPLITIAGRMGSWEEPPWPVACDLARTLPAGSWTLIGGLMVKLHAELASLPPSRSTVDVDSALHLETNRVTFGQVAGTLEGSGYVLDPTTRFAYRFTRGSDRVDVMCADRFAIWRSPKFNGRPLFGVPGGTRALQQTMDVDLETSTGFVRISLPSLRGALVLKGAAFLEDSRERDRHTEDGVMLLACLSDVTDVLVGLSQRSRRRIRALLNALDGRESPWAAHDPVVQSLARESWEDLASKLGLPAH